MTHPAPPPPLSIVLVEPEIPANTGNIARTCLATGSALHLVRPLGFSTDDRQLKRAGLDYWHDVEIHYWDNLDAFLAATAPFADRRFFFTTKARHPYYSVAYQPGDWLIFGRETKGLPEPLLAANSDQCVTIPMNPPPSRDAAHVRSLNLAVSVGIALFEARRQFAARRPE